MTSTTSARRLLLGRVVRRERRGDRERSDLGLELDRVEASTGDLPEERRELEVAVGGPVGHHADDVPEVLLGIESVEPRRCDKREDATDARGVIVAAGKEPSFAADCRAPERALRSVVVEHEPAVVEEARERGLLPMSVAEGRVQQAALMPNDLVLGVDLREEGVDMRTEMHVTQALDLRGRLGA